MALKFYELKRDESGHRIAPLEKSVFIHLIGEVSREKRILGKAKFFEYHGDVVRRSGRTINHYSL
jgi:hypothetical protein